MRSVLACGLAFAALAASAPVVAEPRRETDAARADALFAQGKEDMAAGRFPRACALLAESYALDPSDGTLLALGLCHEQQGDLVRAFDELREAGARAARSGRDDRQRVARAALARLGPRVARVVVHGAGAPTCASARLDDRTLDEGELDVELAVEPGEHRVVCERAAGAAATVRVRADAGSLRVVDVAAAAGVAAAGAPPAADAAPRRAPAARPAAEEEGSPRRTLGFVLGGVGLAALGVGGFFGVRAIDQWSTARDKCDPRACTEPSAVADTDAARTSATVANVGIVAGAVLVAGAAYLLLTGGAPAKRAAFR